MLKVPAKLILIACALVFIGCEATIATTAKQELPPVFSDTHAKPALDKIKSPEIRKVLGSAIAQTETTIGYSQNYYVIPYPNGDVPQETGACTDVIVRAFRSADVDLQKEVHEDMRDNFSKYPTKWGLAVPDTNIDHRRVLNLQTFFERKEKSLRVTKKGEDYAPGDVVTWDLDGKGLTHTGLVSNIWNNKTQRYLIIHNIGGGARLEDRIFDWSVTGHYRYF